MSDDGAFGLALLLAALAGWVDVAGLGGSGGVFLSFMSGNTTDLAVALTQQEFTRGATIGAIVVLFVAGVVTGEFVEPFGGRGGRSLVLGIEALALGTGAAFRWPGSSIPVAISLFPLVFAMGLQNATMHRAGGVSIGLTYVTGTLVQIGRGIAGLMGGGGDGRKLWRYVALWLSLAAGAGLGALALSVSTLAALATAAVAAGSLAFMTTSNRG